MNQALSESEMFQRLTNFWSMFPFYTARKHQKSKGFLVFSGGIKWEYWPEMGSQKKTFITLGIDTHVRGKMSSRSYNNEVSFMVNIKMLWFFLSSFCGCFLFYHYHTKATLTDLI